MIDLILVEYRNISKTWEGLHDNYKLNLKKKLVKDIRLDHNIFEYVLEYRAFLSNYLEFTVFNMPGVSTRVKAQNSIESKVQKYIDKNKEHGESPINKCLNDLFGIRIILNENINFDELYTHINMKYKLKCIDASKYDEVTNQYNYIAYHIYFKKEKDNYSFPWELQIWEEKNRESNFDSHFKYKQEYTEWEKLSEGGKTQK